MKTESTPTAAAFSLGARVRAAVDAIRGSGAAHYVVAVFAVQGLSYLTQLVIARATGPADFAVVRTVESAINLLLVLASLGMPMLAVTTIAGLEEPAAQGRMIGGLLTISVAGGLLMAVVATVGAPLFDVTATPAMRALAWVMAITAASRTAMNYFQGRQQVHRVAAFSVVLAAVSLVVVVACVMVGGLGGWIVGRYVSEALFLVMMCRAIGPTLSFSGPLPGAHRVGSLVSAGVGVALSLLVRSAGDNAGIFLLNAMRMSATDIGYFGLSSLVLVAILIVPGSLPSVALPRLVARLDDPPAVRRLVRRVGAGALGASVLLAAVTGGFAPLLVRWLLPSYEPAVPLLAVLLVAVPFRLLSSMSGMVLVACAHVRYTVWINLIGLTATVATGWPLTDEFGVRGMAVAVVLGEVASALAYVVTARRVLLARLR